MTMVYVPEGNFLMGSNSGDDNEKPIHTVYLDAFWIDQTEVTNAMYANCVNDGGFEMPSNTTYYSYSNYSNHPVVYASWDDASDYCAWAGRRLPTEAEWEKAARGKNAFTYPWGNSKPNHNLSNYSDGVGDVTEVGKYPSGASPYGALDMAGNVWEFTADWYDPNYYANSPASNPKGPSSGTEHTVRGGSMFMESSHMRAAFGGTGVVHAMHGSQGFRYVLRTLP